MKSFCALAMAYVCLCMGSPALADIVVDGTIFYISGAPLGTPNTGDTVSTIDKIYFTVNSPGITNIDILSWEQNETSGLGQDANGDGEIAFMDSYIYLFNDDGSLDLGDYVTENDDAPATFGEDDGSLSDLDSYISINLAAGDYVLTVGGFFYEASEGIAGQNPGTGNGLYPVTQGAVPFETLVHSHGDYRVTISGNVGVPEPGSVAALGFACMLFLVRRRRV